MKKHTIWQLILITLCLGANTAQANNVACSTPRALCDEISTTLVLGAPHCEIQVHNDLEWRAQITFPDAIYSNTQRGAEPTFRLSHTSCDDGIRVSFHTPDDDPALVKAPSIWTFVAGRINAYQIAHLFDPATMKQLQQNHDKWIIGNLGDQKDITVKLSVASSRVLTYIQFSQTRAVDCRCIRPSLEYLGD